MKLQKHNSRYELASMVLHMPVCWSIEHCDDGDWKVITQTGIFCADDVVSALRCAYAESVVDVDQLSTYEYVDSGLRVGERFVRIV